MFIPDDPFLGTHYIGKEELRAVNKVIKSKSLFRYHGPNLQYTTNELEKKLAEYLNVKYVLACSNGTAALKIACIGCGIGPGDEVLMSPFTFIASASSVLSCGAVPKFVEIDKTMNIDVTKIEENIGPKTKAIMAIHMQGVPCNMKAIKKVAKKHSLKIIEDVAQAFGSKYNGKFGGTIGDVGAFSLQAGKTITCGEGGFIATNNKQIYEIAKMYHDNGGYRIGNNYPTWENGKTFYGENFKLTEIQSAIALEQLKKIKKIIAEQEKKYNYIVNKLEFNRFTLRPVGKEITPVRTSLCFHFENKTTCDNFINEMNNKGIGFTKYCSNLINEFDTFKYKKSWHASSFPYNISSYINTKCNKTKELYERTAWFNLSASLNKKHLNYIVKTIKEYENEK